MRRSVVLVLALALTACSHSRYYGPVTVRANLVLQSSFVTSSGACQGAGALSEYAAGHRLLVDDQDSRPVSSPVLPQGVRGASGCEFHVTVTLPRQDRSLWLPMSELGIAACGSSHRGAVIWDRSTRSVRATDSTLALPPNRAARVPALCS